MKPISELLQTDISQIKLIAFDSDGVLVKKGTEIIQNKGYFSQKTNLVDPKIISKLNELKKHFHIVINSGRSSLYLTQIYQDVLWDNVTLISEVGVFLTGEGYLVQTNYLDKYELTAIHTIREKLGKLIGDPRVAGFEPKQFLTTLHCHQDIPEVQQLVAESDPENKFYCWWNQEAYDINSKKFTKTQALNKLLLLKHLSLENVITVGNGINDADLTTKKSINISTDPTNLQTDDFFAQGEHDGGLLVINHLLSLL
ncbi:MAG: HAD hydrolase family protein [Candidatus Shapirobacteria bacterium]